MIYRKSEQQTFLERLKPIRGAQILSIVFASILQKDCVKLQSLKNDQNKEE